jgi:hypothetical protein
MEPDAPSPPEQDLEPPVIDGEALAHLTELLRSGRTEDADAELEALAALAADASALDAEGDPRRVVLDAVLAEPHTGGALTALEEWLDDTVDATAALPLAASWGLPAAELDLDAARGDARLYIDAYPLEARVLGGMTERAATWLVARIAQTVTPAERLSAVRRAVVSLAQAASPGFPSAAASLRAVADDVDDDALWHQVAVGIVESEALAGRRGTPA